MIVTVTEFAQLARDQNGHLLPLGTNRLAARSSPRPALLRRCKARRTS
jgi:hypothetical protein